MVDNFDIILPLLEFPDNDTYYDLQVIRRGKDHPDMPSANRTIKSYYICRLESLVSLKEEIKTLCELFGARAYINLTPKSLYKTSLLQLKYLSERIYEGDVKKIWKSWSTCVGNIKGNESRWVVDIDEPFDGREYLKFLVFLNELEPVGDKYIAKIPTKSGYHIISKPFNLMEFKKEYPNIDVHKNNPTILYVP